MNVKLIAAISAALALQACATSHHKEAHGPVADEVIAEQRAALAKNTEGKGFGPQAPRDIDSKAGNNTTAFNTAPAYTSMNLCNIHFHKNAEHKGGEFNKYAGNGDGHGYHSGYVYSGQLSAIETQKIDAEICPSKHGALYPGDTIEVHYVHSTAQVKPGPTLGSCLSDANKNPQLRVETQVYVLVNDKNALDFMELTKHGVKNGVYQALNIPSNTGEPVQYAGSTTGPGYNEKGSPFQVSWSVRPKVAKVNIETVGQWCKGNAFDEDHAHGVRNLVINPDLLSKIQ
ncbi:delta-class carbonic anhydrase [Thiomicrorhabdus sp. zzn3]|uniref:delta-class carbonic anhydrase n=1 Tax=Thiomicrorhabdus sp. zzn3 TaxID=3039775 RepID=UPI002437087D|nr:delta-class carbonic anhydrase [Thiomicrorhabdus sp. zzn3]MDG6777258.1 delta-class carbonic anhydrase [Thiomicrorhabdus sp. zzn3]